MRRILPHHLELQVFDQQFAWPYVHYMFAFDQCHAPALRRNAAVGRFMPIIRCAR